MTAARGALIAGAAAALALGASAVAQAPGDGRLAFAVDGDLYARPLRNDVITLQSAPPAGSPRTVLVRVAGHDRALRPRISPGGTRLAYVRLRCFDCRHGRRADIVVTDIRGAGARVVTTVHRAVSGLAWSADGRSLLFASSRLPSYAKRYSQRYPGDLFRVAVAGGRPHRLTVTPKINEYDPSPGPDGGVLYGRNAGRRTLGDIWLLPADGTGARAVDRARTSAFAPQLSPDGTQVVFAESPTRGFTGTSLTIIDIDGVGRHALTPPVRGRFDISPAWSPDGTRIAFVSDRGSRSAGRGKPLSDVYIVGAQGGTPALSVTLPGHASVHDVDWR